MTLRKNVRDLIRTEIAKHDPIGEASLPLELIAETSVRFIETDAVARYEIVDEAGNPRTKVLDGQVVPVTVPDLVAELRQKHPTLFKAPRPEADAASSAEAPAGSSSLQAEPLAQEGPAAAASSEAPQGDPALPSPPAPRDVLLLGSAGPSPSLDEASTTTPDQSLAPPQDSQVVGILRTTSALAEETPAPKPHPSSVERPSPAPIQPAPRPAVRLPRLAGRRALGGLVAILLLLGAAAYMLARPSARKTEPAGGSQTAMTTPPRATQPPPATPAPAESPKVVPPAPPAEPSPAPVQPAPPPEAAQRAAPPAPPETPPRIIPTSPPAPPPTPPSTPSTPPAAPAATPSPAPTAAPSNPSAYAGPGNVSGVPEILDTGTLRVGGKVLRLFGVEWARGGQAEDLTRYLRGREVTCRPATSADVYRCQVDGRDLSEVVLFNGGARATPEASPELIAAEGHARSERIGVWKK